MRTNRGFTLLEMTVATHCADNHDFAEGVRAGLEELAPALLGADPSHASQSRSRRTCSGSGRS